MRGGHDQSWSFHGSHGELAGEVKEGEGKEEAGGALLGAPWGEGGAAMGRGC
jgi:hypothetical protein